MEGGRAQRELRILAFADLHLDRALPWTTRAIGDDTRRAQQVAFDAICSIAAAEADVLISAGDLYDYARHDLETGELLRAGFERLAPMPALLVPGETDPVDGLSLYEHVKWSSNVHVFRDRELTSFTPLPGLTVWAGEPPAAEDAAGGSSRRDFNLAVVHRQAAPEDFEPLRIDHVLAAAGHYPSDGDSTTTPGAAYPVDADDPPGQLVVITVGEAGTVEIGRRDLRTFAPSRPPRRFSTDALATYDLTTIGEEQTLRGEFVRNLLTPEESPVHLRRLALLSGLRALEGEAPQV